MAKKVIALLAVLALVITPLFVIGEDLQADTNDDLTLDDVINSSAHWVSGELKNGVVTLSNTSVGTPETLILDKDGVTGDVNEVKFAEGFKIPAGCTIQACNEATGYTPLTIDKDMTVYGSLFSGFTMGAVTVTIDGGILYAEASVNDSGTGSVAYNQVKTVANSCIKALNNGIIAYADIDYVKTESQSSGTKDFFSATLEMLIGNGFTIKNASTTTNGTKYVFSGEVHGLSNIESYSRIVVQNDHASYEFDNAYLSSMVMNLDEAKEMLITDERNAIDYASTNVIFDLHSTSDTLLKNIKTTEGMKVLIMEMTLDDTEDPDPALFTFYATIDTTGLVPYFNINCVATKGVKSIGEENVVNFVKVGETFNLDDIEVKCESGYHFTGWYYLNDDGIMVKIVNPEQFVALDNMTIYAMAEQNGPNDYTGFFIGLIILLVLIVLAACVGIYLKATEKSVQKTAAKKASKR